MIFTIVLLTLFIVVLLYTVFRVGFSKHVCYAIHFRTKLARMAQTDNTWLETYNRMPSIKRMAWISYFGSLKNLLTEEEQEKYVRYDIQHTKLEGRRKIDLNL
jgi:hypothetical protein